MAVTDYICMQHTTWLTWSVTNTILLFVLFLVMSSIWSYYVCVVRPSDIVVGRLIFYQGFFFLSFFHPLVSELAKRNYTISSHMVGSNCNLKMHVRNLGYPFPLQIGGSKNDLFWWFHNLKANLTAYIYRMKYDIHKWASACKLQGVCYIVWKGHKLWSTDGFKLDCSFHPLYVNLAFHFIARLRWRRSADSTQPHFVKWWMVGRVNNVP